MTLPCSHRYGVIKAIFFQLLYNFVLFIQLTQINVIITALKVTIYSSFYLGRNRLGLNTLAVPRISPFSYTDHNTITSKRVQTRQLY